MFHSALSRHTEAGPLAVRLPQLSGRKMVLTLVALVLLATPLLAWGITGADPYAFLQYVVTGHATIKEVTRYDEDGNVLSVKQVYRLGNPEALARCQEMLDTPHLAGDHGEVPISIEREEHVVSCP